MGGSIISALFLLWGSSLVELELKRTGIDLKLYELSQQIVKTEGFELYDVVYVPGSSTLKVFIMNPETKSAVIEDCIKVDRAFSPYCETEDWIPEDFVLEVSSPGVYRSLKTLRHFELSLGEVILCQIVGGLPAEEVSKLPKGLQKSNKLRGKLNEVRNETILLEVEGVEIEVPFALMKKASLDPDL